MRALLPLAALALLAAVTPGAAACTVEPVHVCTIDTALLQVCTWGPCPPATMGGVHVRVLDQAITLPLPG